MCTIKLSMPRESPHANIRGPNISNGRVGLYVTIQSSSFSIKYHVVVGMSLEYLIMI